MSKKLAHARARLESALDVLRPLLKVASDAAHEVEALEKGEPKADDEEEEAYFDRISELGILADFGSHLCVPCLRVLNSVAAELIRGSHNEEGDDAEQPSVS